MNRDELRTPERDRDREIQERQGHKNPGSRLSEMQSWEIDRQTDRLTDGQTEEGRRTELEERRQVWREGDGWGCSTAVNLHGGNGMLGTPLPARTHSGFHPRDTLASPHPVALGLHFAPINPDLRSCSRA